MSGEPKRTAVVTGGAGAIGSAICLRLLRDGWTVHALDLRPGENADVGYIVADVTSPDAVDEVAARFDRLDLLVNGAGFGDRAPAETMTPHQWSSVVDTCLSGTFYVARAFHAALAESGGTVVNIASAAANNPLELHANYCAAKAGVVALTEVLALEWSGHGIRVFAVSPGFVATRRQKEGLAEMPRRQSVIEARTPLGRLVEVQEIADAIVELASPTFAYLTGTNVLIDGGFSTDGGGSGLFAQR